MAKDPAKDGPTWIGNGLTEANKDCAMNLQESFAQAIAERSRRMYLSHSEAREESPRQESRDKKEGRFRKPFAGRLFLI